jgi:HEAT repeat protein
MLRWFTRKKDALRCGGRTAFEWYSLHRARQYRHDDWDRSLAQAIYEITQGLGPEEARDCMTHVLSADSSDAARCVAAIQLSIDPPQDAEEALIAALQDESEEVRRTAAASLVRIGSVRGFAAVAAGSRHGCAVRTEAARQLGRLKEGARDAVPALMTLLQYPRINWRTHYIAADALAAIGNAAVPSLLRGVSHGTPMVQYYAATALQEIAKTSELASLINEELRRAGRYGDDNTPPW